jgi:hypothetical protein
MIKNGASETLSYRAALFFGAGLTVVALVVNFAFVRVPRDKNTGEEEELRV